MQFTPDTRNVGGRQIIISQLWGHRLCLQQIKERQINLDLRNQFDKKNENQKYLTYMISIWKYTKEAIDHQRMFDRQKQKEPSYFFRRLPSPTNISSLQNKLNNIKSKSTQEKMLYTKLLPPPNIELSKFIPESTKTKVDWEACIKTLQGPQYPIKNGFDNQQYKIAFLMKLILPFQQEFQYKHIKQNKQLQQTQSLNQLRNLKSD